MSDSGPYGRFNRAQRAAFNVDEALPLFLTGLLLQTSVFGLPGLLPAVGFAYGTIQFCELYKKSVKERSAGFLPRVMSEACSASLVGVIAIKGPLGPMLPF